MDGDVVQWVESLPTIFEAFWFIHNTPYIKIGGLGLYFQYIWDGGKESGIQGYP